MAVSLFGKLKNKLFGHRCTPESLRKRGAQVGKGVHIYSGKIDLNHAWLLTIGNNVTLSDCRILLHDAGTKAALGYTRVGRVEIGDNVFVGADAIILPNVKIGSDVIIGAGCVVTKDIPDNSVVVGNPCRVISSYEAFIEKNRQLMQQVPVYHTYWKDKTQEDKARQRADLLNGGIGFDL